MDIEGELKQYIIDNFMYSADAEDLTNDLHLFDAGVIDSTGVLELVGFLEETFEVAVDDTEMLPENFESVTALAKFVRSKQS
jgi:acyl carrier protein